MGSSEASQSVQQAMIETPDDDLVQDRVRAAVGQRERTAGVEKELERIRLHELFMQAPAAICLLSGPDHVFTLTNPRYLALVGRDDILGKPVREVFPELADQKIFTILDDVYRTGQTYVGDEMPVRLDRDRDGLPDDIYFNFVYAPLRTPDGETEGIFAHAYEITDQVRARQQLEAEVTERARAESLLAGERAVLELIARGVPLGQALNALARFIESEMAGAICSILLAHPDGTLRHGAAPSLPDEYNRAIDGIEIGPAAGSCGTAAYRDEPVIVADIATDPLWHDFRDLALTHGLRACWSTPVHSADGQIVGTFAVYHREVHHPDQRERAIVETLSYLAGIAISRARGEEQRGALLNRERVAREAAEAAVRSRDEFLSIASHELRTPVTGIKGTAQLTLRAHDRGKLTVQRSVKALKSIHQSVDRLSTLIDDLLDVSRLRGGQLSLRPEQFDLVQFIREIVDRYDQQVDTPFTFEQDLPPPPLTIVADPGRLEQVFDNLLSNAVKYSPNGGSIRISATFDESGINVAVRDQGIGLPGGSTDQIFEPFGRAENATTRHIRGLGLGLYISRRIVTLHGGRLWAESLGTNEGTTMRLWLPPDRLAPSDEE
jgi:PAS domain S-box-containing protein